MPKASVNNNWHYNISLQPLARKLRNNATKAEACLWKYALKSEMTGHRFSRQRPVLNYIADFMCRELLLIIEVDGASHLLEDIAIKDLTRQSDLEKAGFTVLRFQDKDVLHDMKKVKEVIDNTIRALR